MNMVNVNEYLNLSNDSSQDLTLVKKVGRIFVGPTSTMTRMMELMRENKIPVHNVDTEFLTNPDNKTVVETFNHCQLRTEDHGFRSWSTVYTPVGYILKVVF